METIYFSSWVVPIFVSINLFLFLAIFLLFVGFTLSYIKLKEKKFKTALPYLFLLTIAVGYFTIRPLFQVYFIRVESDGTKILKNCYHITIGKIEKIQKFTTNTQQKNLRGRGVQTLFIQVGEKTYKTVSATPEQIQEANNKLLKY